MGEQHESKTSRVERSRGVISNTKLLDERNSSSEVCPSTLFQDTAVSRGVLSPSRTIKLCDFGLATSVPMRTPARMHLLS